MNYDIQDYRGLKLQLNDRSDYRKKKAKEYNIISARGYVTDLKIWIPNTLMDEEGTLDTSKNFMWLFNKDDVIEKLYKAGYEFTY